MQVLRGDVGPLSIGQQPVGLGGDDRQVIDRPGVGADVAGQHRRGQQPGEPADVEPAIGPPRRLQQPGIAVAGDDVRVAVVTGQPALTGLALQEQVAQQPADISAPPAHLPDHRRPPECPRGAQPSRRASVAVSASTPSTARAQPATACRSHTGAPAPLCIAATA